MSGCRCCPEGDEACFTTCQSCGEQTVPILDGVADEFCAPCSRLWEDGAECPICGLPDPHEACRARDYFHQPQQEGRES